MAKPNKRNPFGQAMRKMRLSLDISITEAALRMMMTRQYLSMVETGNALPPLSRTFLERLHKTLFMESTVTAEHLLELAYVCRAPAEIRPGLLAAIKANPVFQFCS